MLRKWTFDKDTVLDYCQRFADKMELPKRDWTANDVLVLAGVCLSEAFRTILEDQWGYEEVAGFHREKREALFHQLRDQLIEVVKQFEYLASLTDGPQFDQEFESIVELVADPGPPTKIKYLRGKKPSR